MKTIISSITLLALGVWLLKLYITNDLALLILPRYNTLILLSAIALIISAIIVLKNYKQSWHGISHHTNYRQIALFIVVMIIQVNTALGLTTSSASQRGETEIKNIKLNHNFNASIPSTERSFGDWIHILKSKDLTEAEQGKTVKISGFVYNNTDKTTLSLSRFLIRCCAADAQFVSLPVLTDEKFENDQWVEITGTIVGSEIQADTITKIPTPKVQYIN